MSQRGATLRGRIMSCFSCCGEDNSNKPADGGGSYMMKNSAGRGYIISKITPS